jgi:homoserine kinase
VSGAVAQQPGPLHLRLPATSANLGPGFDAVGLAMALYLTIDAEPSDNFSIAATGRGIDLSSRLDRNLILDTYREVLAAEGKNLMPLGLRIDNGIPIGMGCGSSAAALLAGVLLANHFGGLAWTAQHCMEEACRREGHPDNVAACALGYFTVSATDGPNVVSATFGESLTWKLLLALPSASLATKKARALLPGQYSQADAVANVQRSSLLVSAFALGRGDLLRVAMQDCLHQPYRMDACPLLPLLLPLAGQGGILGVALSGAGPGVLLIADPSEKSQALATTIRAAAGDPGLEIVETTIAGGALAERASL